MEQSAREPHGYRDVFGCFFEKKKKKAQDPPFQSDF